MRSVAVSAFALCNSFSSSWEACQHTGQAAWESYLRTALLGPARNGDVLRAVILLRWGADKDALDNDECTPLTRAARGGHLRMVKTLLAAGADIRPSCRYFGCTALLEAVYGGHDRIVVALLAGGADTEAGDSCGRTPLMLAARGGKLAVVRTLLAAGADLTARQDIFGGTALHVAARFGHDRVVDALLAGGGDKDALDNLERTPLTEAAERGHVPVVKTLLAAGADETVESADGETPADKTTCERVRKLLDRAPVDRAWRRRGWLVMINSRTLKARAAGGSDGGDAGARSAKRRRGLTGVVSNLLGLVMLHAAAGKVRASGGGGCDDDLVAVVSELLALELDGVFRNVVSFL